jgi:hypothetical protein
MAIALARHVKAGRGITTPLIQLRKTIQEGLDQQRNQAVHGINIMVDGKWAVEMHRGSRRGPARPLPIADLAATLNDLTEAEHAYSLAFRAWLTDWRGRVTAVIARKMRAAAAETVSESGS